jgi:hypothetical protein
MTEYSDFRRFVERHADVEYVSLARDRRYPTTWSAEAMRSKAVMVVVQVMWQAWLYVEEVRFPHDPDPEEVLRVLFPEHAAVIDEVVLRACRRNLLESGR